MTETPTQDNSFRTALESLKTSSAAIEKHAKVLEAQREALLAFNPRNGVTENLNSASQQHEQESGRLMFAVSLENHVGYFTTLIYTVGRLIAFHT